MSVSFITSASGVPKNIREMPIHDVIKLHKLLSGPVSQINKSNIKIVKNEVSPMPLSCFTSHALSILCISVGNFLSGYTDEVYTSYQENEIQLVVAMAENNSNVSKAAISLDITRDELRAAIKRFEVKWSLDLTTYTGLCQAYTYAMAS